MKLCIAAFNSLARDISGMSLPAPMLPALSREEIMLGETSNPLPRNTAFVELKSTDDGIVVFMVAGGAEIDRVAIDGGETRFLGVQAGWSITLKDILS